MADQRGLLVVLILPLQVLSTEKKTSSPYKKKTNTKDLVRARFENAWRDHNWRVGGELRRRSPSSSTNRKKILVFSLNLCGLYRKPIIWTKWSP